MAAMAEQRRWRVTPESSNSGAAQPAAPLPEDPLPHPMIYRERIAIGPLRKYKVTEWIWIGWCICEDSETRVQEKTSEEPYSRCTVCRKFAKDLTRCSSISNKCQDATHPFSNLEEAFASISSAAPPAKSVTNNAEQPA